MKLLKFKNEKKRGWQRREIDLEGTPLKKSAALQISQLTLGRDEQYHINKKGCVLCIVVEGWMEAHCSGRNYMLKQGEGIVFEPRERHRINNGKGWMISVSSVNYRELNTEWER